MSIDLSGNPFYLNDRQIGWVQSTFAGLTTEEKVGQLFCVMGGDYSPDRLRDMVAAGKIGGVLFRPVKSGEEIAADYAPLDAAAKIPLLKAANLEEGGSGGASDGTLFGWPMTVGATNDTEIAEKFAKVCAAEARTAGINWTFSPVSDLSINPLNPIINVRAFGSDSDLVMEMAGQYARTIQKYGVAACAKHFPGDGVDFRDQHLHPTYNSLPADQWYATYGKVYRCLIGGGILSFMVGHIAQPEVQMQKNPALRYEDCLPASLSRELMTGVLREEFGFNGVIASDATIMGGFTMAMPRHEAIPTAVNAGVDVLVFNTDFDEDYSYLLEAVQTGVVSTVRLNEAVIRVLALKAKLCLNDWPVPIISTQEWCRECADKAVTLAKSTRNILPVTPEKYPAIRLVLLGEDTMIDGSIRETAVAYLKEKGFRVEVYDPYADDLHGTNELPRDRLTIMLANYQTASNQVTVRVNWCAKHALDIPRYIHEEDSVFISLSNPYHLMDVPRVPVYINTYSATSGLLLAALEKLVGDSEFKGVSPVDAFCGLQDTHM